MSDASRTRLVSLVLLVVVFASGAIVGAAFDRTLGAEEPMDGGTPLATTVDEDNEGGEQRREALWERVGPSEEQRMAIDSMLAHHRASMKGLQREFRSAYNPRYWAIVDSTRASILSVFDSAQASEYDSLTNAYDERRRDGENGNRFP